MLTSIIDLFTITMTHYFIDQLDTAIFYPPISSLTLGAMEFIDLFHKANNGLPIRIVLTGLVTSTNDLTIFIFKGISRKN